MPRTFVDMKRTPEDKAAAAMQSMPATPFEGGPDYPYGLCISLDETDIEKIGLSDDVQVGDLIDIRMLGKVTSVRKESRDGKECCRVEIQGQQIAIEDEDTEEPGDEKEQRKPKDPRPASTRRYGALSVG
jgi:hypothetical protein